MWTLDTGGSTIDPVVSRDTPKKKFSSVNFFEKIRFLLRFYIGKETWTTLKDFRLFVDGPKYQMVQKF